MEQIWWERVPNAAAFTTEMIENLLSEKSIILHCCGDLPWYSYMVNFIKESVKQQNSSKRFESIQDVSEPGKYLLKEFCKQEKRAENMDLSKDKMAMQRLKEAAEKAKKELSTTTTTNINLPFITMNQDGPKHLDVTLTRAKFDELTSDLVDRTMQPVRQALSDADLTANDIDKE